MKRKKEGEERGTQKKGRGRGKGERENMKFGRGVRKIWRELGKLHMIKTFYI